MEDIRCYIVYQSQRLSNFRIVFYMEDVKLWVIVRLIRFGVYRFFAQWFNTYIVSDITTMILSNCTSDDTHYISIRIYESRLNRIRKTRRNIVPRKWIFLVQLFLQTCLPLIGSSTKREMGCPNLPSLDEIL